MIEDLAAGLRGLPIKGLKPELENLYGTLTPVEGLGRPSRPQDFGYSNVEARHELAAEAIRAYLMNTNFLKTAAPKTAAAIRAMVNSHPTLSKLIQFNALGGLAVLGGADELIGENIDDPEG
jgi:hypothetical protein